ncbi:arginase family protein [Leifsonia sp. NPDC058292]|uniref:arginase family protein n=1 Tax=Leifsonia sp. NPDC058292 TaxID=3346428 RepID=UPI0036D7FAEE
MSGATFLVVPQWQGSGSSRAMRLIDGAEAIRGDLPSAATTVVPVPASAGDSLGTGVHRFSSLISIRDAVLAELSVLEAPVITIGGDCGADLGGIQYALAGRPPGSVAVVWFDAHGDLNDVDSSPSGAFHGMVVRALLGDGAEGLASTGAAVLPRSNLVLAGTRALDDGEESFVTASGISVLSADDVADPQTVVEAVAATGATAVYLHIDLDVLDPATMDGIGYPEPFGVQPGQLADAVRALRARFELAGAAITEFAPESPENAERDLPVILRILGSLTAALPAAAGDGSASALGGSNSSTNGGARHLSTDSPPPDDTV